MAKALQCDRCGMYYPVYINQKEGNSARLIISNSEEFQLKVVRHWSLCKSCRDAFVDFMTIGEEERKKMYDNPRMDL